MAEQAISEHNDSNSQRYECEDKTDSTTDNKIMKPKSVVPYHKNITLVEKSNMLISVCRMCQKIPRVSLH